MKPNARQLNSMLIPCRASAFSKSTFSNMVSAAPGGAALPHSRYAPVRERGGPPLRRRHTVGTEFIARIGGEIRDVCGMIERQTQLADFVGKSQPPVVLHRPGLRRIRLRGGRDATVLVDDHRRNAPATKLISQHQAAWPARQPERRRPNCFLPHFPFWSPPAGTG